MRPLRYSTNVTLDGCYDHRVMIPDEDLHRHAAANLQRADALLLRFAQTIDRAKKYVVSGTIHGVAAHRKNSEYSPNQASAQLARVPAATAQ